MTSLQYVIKILFIKQLHQYRHSTKRFLPDSNIKNKADITSALFFNLQNYHYSETTTLCTELLPSLFTILKK